MALQFSLLLLVVSAALFVLRQRMKRDSPLPLPPGPPALPLIGNLLDMPTNRAVGFQALCAKYGDIVHLDFAGQPMIVLGSQEVASELLEKKSSAIAQLLSRGLTRGLSLFGSSIMRVVYGIEVDEEPVDYLTMAEDTMAIFSEVLQPGKYLVEVLPFLRYLPSWVPGATVMREGLVWRRVVWKLVEEPWKFVMAAMKGGTARPSMAAFLMADVPQSYGESNDVSEEEEIYRSASATAYAAGADTILSTVQTFFLAMASHPQVLKKAQAELDAVVGPHRLPDFEDMKSLPYICALLKELLRWRVVGQLGFPHRALEDDEYHGYFIPKGSTLIPNIWAISRDPNFYRDPDIFLPERFLKDGELDPDVRDPATFVFGYGRRICPGRHYATSVLFIVVSTVLHTLSVTAPLDKDGNPVRLEGKMTDGLISHPEPFECVIKPRSEQAAALIKASCGNFAGVHE